MTAQETTSVSTKPTTTGILILHGIGAHRPAEALGKAATPLLDYLSLRPDNPDRKPRPHARIDAVEVGQATSEDARPEVRASITEPNGTRRWILREARWSGLIQPPKFKEMLVWALRLLWRTEMQILRPMLLLSKSMAADGLQLALEELGLRRRRVPLPALDPSWLDGTSGIHELTGRTETELRVAGALGRVVDPTGDPQFDDVDPTVPGDPFGTTSLLGLLLIVGVVIFALGTTLIAIALVPISIIALAVVYVAAALPRVGARARRIQEALVESIGDTYVWQENTLLRSAVLTSVDKDLVALARDCDQVAIVAHSQGAAIAYELLIDPLTPIPSNVQLLITYGQGITRVNDVEPGVPLDAPWSPAFAWLDFSSSRDLVSVERLPSSELRHSELLLNRSSARLDHSS